MWVIPCLNRSSTQALVTRMPAATIWICGLVYCCIVVGRERVGYQVSQSCLDDDDGRVRTKKNVIIRTVGF
jgi:hypothetical protein